MTGETLCILHFNDVYDIEPRKTDPCGGAARFATLVKKYLNCDPLLLFSGDALNPSFLSSFTRGKHMVDILNELKVDCAVVGNHDFDFGADALEDAVEASKFPWLLSNVTDNITNGPLIEAPKICILERGGLKIGIIGLVEAEWLVTLSTIDPDDITVHDFVVEGRKLTQELREKGCNLIVALTHMRWPNNVKLATNVDGIDLVLCGHDHFYQLEMVNGKWVVCSGTDFCYLTEFMLTFDDAKQLVSIVPKTVPITRDIPEDLAVQSLVKKYAAVVDEKLDKVLGTMNSDLDGRFMVVRLGESNLGNLICDIACSGTNADCAIINSGTFRSDRIHNAGPFTMRDLVSILPFIDFMVVIRVTGRQLHEALENGVSEYPKLEGRFPQVSNIRFIFNASKPSKHRIDPNYVVVDDERLDLDKEYALATKAYIAQGKDGYDVLNGSPYVIDDEMGISLSTLVQNYFTAISVIKGFTHLRSPHRQCIVPRRASIARKSVSQMWQDAASRISRSRSSSIREVEESFACQAPAIQGRILVAKDDQV